MFPLPISRKKKMRMTTQKLPINKLQKVVPHEGQWKLKYSCHSTLSDLFIFGNFEKEMQNEAITGYHDHPVGQPKEEKTSTKFN